MTRSFTPSINPALLVWARKTAALGVPEAARRLKIEEPTLLAWEAGEAAPTFAQLQKASEAYKRPLALFMLPEPPRTWNVIHDYRRLPAEGEEEQNDLSPKLALELRRARERRLIALDLFDEEEVPQFGVVGAATEDADTLAARIRSGLAVSLAKQAAWRDHHEALNGWIAAAEAMGALVFQASGITTSEMRGVSVGEFPLPAIILNGGDSVRGRIFSLMHELVHLSLRQDALCLLNDNDKTEVFCNRVAGAVLVPADALLADSLVARTSAPVEWTDDEIQRLATRFKVSNEAIARRLTIVGRATDAFYVRKRAEYAARYAEYLAGKEHAAKPGGGPPYPLMVIRNLGYAYTSAVFGAYHERRLSVADVGAYLDVKVKHLAAVEKQLWGGRAERA